MAQKYVSGHATGWKNTKRRDGRDPGYRFSYSDVFAFGGDRIYIRSMYDLICVGR